MLGHGELFLAEKHEQRQKKLEKAFYQKIITKKIGKNIFSK
jgi:hypothetical protein